ncbi:hypothetical protein [Maribacter sp. 2-571]|uniref:hypothetical protein n=1 Tax=Maribacter sp. 2-571 TaxID=3417569 RepID=UPI003D330D29
MALLSLWFFNCCYWWRKYILIALCTYLFSFAKVFVIASGYETSFHAEFVWPAVLGLLFLLVILFMDKKVLRSSKGHHFKKYYLTDKKLLRTRFESFKTSLESLKNKKKQIEAKPYLYQVYYNKLLVGRYLFGDQSGNRINTPKVGAFERLVCILLLLFPFFYFLHELIPPDVSEYQVLIWTIDNHGFIDAQAYFWYMSQIWCFMLVLIIWYITEHRWWRHAILSPFVLGAYRLTEAYFTKTGFVDEPEYIKAVPFMISIVTVLVLLSRLVRVKYQILDIHDWLENELEELLKNA